MIITKVRRYSKKKIFTNNELKCSVLPKYIKKKVFERLNSFHYEVFAIIFDKTKRTKNYIGYTNKELYDNLACELAKMLKINRSSFTIIDKSKNKKHEMLVFNKKFKENLNLHKNYKISIIHKNSIDDKALQIADIIEWSIFQSKEHNNDEYITMINNLYLKQVN
ncbi:MAG: hypothetical protein BZ137_00255 [Methanosphaera sp. rholeuAM130]|nr:MAG: hypothetical protein BZ137_00255 [Methanosphaera sp. rholeuAM130]